MATSWKSQQGDGKYALQFETDDKEKYKTVEKAAQRAIDGNASDVVEVVRCKDCVYWESVCGRTTGKCESPRNGLLYEYTDNLDFCSYGERQ